PDIRQAEEKLVAANARIGVAKAAYYPTISLTGLFGSESMALSNLFTSGAGIWSAALGLAMPVFDAGRTGARVDQATAVQKESLANYRKTVQTAFKEVNDAIVGLREYSEEEAAYSAQVGSSQKALDLAQKRYESGYSGYMDLLDAQRTLNGAQLQYLASRKSRLGAAVDLFKALGGGWVAG
ncbi:MAG: TolC family protein, partial [Dechloromonas sp.]|nr:TolC family protein [Dechloromonas sp.]